MLEVTNKSDRSLQKQLTISMPFNTIKQRWPLEKDLSISSLSILMKTLPPFTVKPFLTRPNT